MSDNSFTSFRKDWSGVEFLVCRCGCCGKDTKCGFEVYTNEDGVPEVEVKCYVCGASVYSVIPLIPNDVVTFEELSKEKEVLEDKLGLVNRRIKTFYGGRWGKIRRESEARESKTSNSISD